MGRLSKVTAGCFALAAFAVATFGGLAAGNAASLVLVRALIAMILCYPVGLIVGIVLQRVISMQFEAGTAAEQTTGSRDAATTENRDGNDEEVIVV